MDNCSLMAIRADTLYTYDTRGRMLLCNEPEGRPAPRVFLGRTLGGHVLRYGETVPDEIVRRLAEIVERLAPVDDLHLPPATMSAVRGVLERQAPIAVETGGPAYRFPESVAQSHEVVQVTDANTAVVRNTYPWLYDALAAWGPCFAVVRDGAAVSICFSSRIGARACEAGVDTLPAFRGRGYASAVTAAWGTSVRAAGLIPLYSTGWDNLASQGVARRLGLIKFGANTNWA